MTTLPSLDEPPAGSACPVCREALRLVGYCAACSWREEDAAVMRLVCCGCGMDMGTKPCVKEQAGVVSSGTCPKCIRRALCA